MSKSKLYIVALVGMFCVTPMVAATAAAQEEHRMYDSVHKDYHTWNGDEDKRYREYLTEQHRKYQDFSRLNKKKQSAYWQWRHDHDDHR